MSVRIEKLIAEYPDMVRDRKCLAYQIAHFRGLSAEEVIESMYTPRQDGERVQTSSLSDKTAQIAMNYRDRLNQMNREWYEHLEKEYLDLTEELRFFESAVKSVSGMPGTVLSDLVFGQMTWDKVAEKHYISRRSVGNYRAKAIVELEKMYQRHDDEVVAYMLS